jgi:hypothetical protein
MVSPTNMRQYRLDLRYERTETGGASFDKVKTRLDAVASQTGMSHVFRLRGVDIFQVVDCRPINAETSAEGLPRVDYLPQIEEFTTRLAECSGLESVINVLLDALAALFGYDHSFLMVPDEDGKRLFTLGSRGFGESGIGSEAWFGEGILGVAAERREVVRTTNFSREVHPAGASTIKHYKTDDSIFIDDAYLIKGIAGRIFWKLVQSYAQSGRVGFTNKEIRLDASLQLPDFKDNPEARLILLRRLQDRCAFVHLTQVGRGQFRLDVQRHLTLEEWP